MHFFLFKTNLHTFKLADSQGTLHSLSNKDEFCQKPNAFVVVIHHFIMKENHTKSLMILA